jgi:hypothetical protein
LGTQPESEHFDDLPELGPIGKPIGSQVGSEDFNFSLDAFGKEADLDHEDSPPSRLHPNPHKAASHGFVSLSKLKDLVESSIMGCRVAGCEAIVCSSTIEELGICWVVRLTCLFGHSISWVSGEFEEAHQTLEVTNRVFCGILCAGLSYT